MPKINLLYVYIDVFLVGFSKEFSFEHRYIELMQWLAPFHCQNRDI